jgi:hypothetical protein
MRKSPFIDFLDTLIRDGLEKFGRYYSEYRGVVYDNEDPQGLSRIKVIVPEITGNSVIDYWAWPIGQMSGQGYGMQALPRKGELVWVSFEKGSTRRPVWKFGYPGLKSGTLNPDKPKHLRSIDNFWFRTPGGMQVELDDTPSVRRIRIAHANQSEVIIDDNTITIKNTEGKLFYIDKDTIKIEHTNGSNFELNLLDSSISYATELGVLSKVELNSLGIVQEIPTAGSVNIKHGDASIYQSNTTAMGDQTADVISDLVYKLAQFIQKLSIYASSQASAAIPTPAAPLAGGFTQLGVDASNFAIELSSKLSEIEQIKTPTLKFE